MSIAVDVLLEDFPVIDPRLPRRTRIEQNETLVHLIHWDRNGLARNSVNIEVNGAHSAIHGWVVILATGRNANQLRLDILRNHTNLLDIDFATDESCQSRGGANHHGRGTGDARSSG